MNTFSDIVNFFDSRDITKDSYNEHFIGIYKNTYPSGFCDHLISEYNQLIENGLGWSRQNESNIKKHQKDDWSLSLQPTNHNLSCFSETDTYKIYWRGLQDAFDSYTNEFSILKEQRLSSTVAKLQRTSPGGGYHIWHCEQGCMDSVSRILVFITYLNSVDKNCGGETEFLYQKLRINPVENTTVIFPAAFTHVHRGALLMGDKYKYISTGWFNLEP